MNTRSLIVNSLCSVLTTGFMFQASAQQAMVLQNGLMVNGQAYQGCKDTYICDHADAAKNFGTDLTLYMAN